MRGSTTAMMSIVVMESAASDEMVNARDLNLNIELSMIFMCMASSHRALPADISSRWLPPAINSSSFW